jgi:hypothetical protein
MFWFLVEKLYHLYVTCKFWFYIPDNATKSLEERPTALNIEVSVLRLEVGAGMAVLAADWLAVLASLLPSFTFHVGPPSYHEK